MADKKCYLGQDGVYIEGAPRSASDIEVAARPTPQHRYDRNAGEWKLDLSALAAAKQQEIDNAYESAMQELLAGYTPSQLQTFFKQESEARAYLADPVASTPFLDAAAPARGISKAALVDKVIAKSDTFATSSGALTGKWQGLRDAIATALEAEDDAALISLGW